MRSNLFLLYWYEYVYLQLELFLILRYVQARRKKGIQRVERFNVSIDNRQYQVCFFFCFFLPGSTVMGRYLYSQYVNVDEKRWQSVFICRRWCQFSVSSFSQCLLSLAFSYAHNFLLVVTRKKWSFFFTQSSSSFSFLSFSKYVSYPRGK